MSRHIGFFTSAAIFAVMLAIALPARLSGQEVNELVVKGKKELENGNIPAAIELLKEAVDDEPEDPEGYLWLGRAYMAVDSIRLAETELIKARAFSNGDARIYESLGDVYIAKKIPAAAIGEYAKAAAIDSASLPLLMKLADTQYKARKYTDAAKTYNTVLGLDPGNMTALGVLGPLYVRAKQYQAALPIMAKLYAAMPDSQKIQEYYVKTLYENKQYEAMIPIAETLYQKDPSLSEVPGMLGTAYKETKAYDRVITMYSTRPVESMTVEEIVGLAKAYRSTERFQEAAVAYEAALAKEPANCAVPYDLGTTYMKLKEYKKAVDAFAKKVACDTTSGYRFASHLNSAMSQMQLKDFEGARQSATRSLEYRPESVQGWLTLAQINLQMKAVKEQRAAYRKVIDIASADTSENGKYERALEEAYRMEGLQEMIDKKYESAVGYFNKALKINPKECSSNLWMAQAYHNLNNKEEAKKFYCRVISLCPKEEDAKKGLEILGMKCGE